MTIRQCLAKEPEHPGNLCVRPADHEGCHVWQSELWEDLAS